MMKCLDGTELFNKQPSSLTSYFLNPACQEIVLRCRVLLPEYAGSGRGSNSHGLSASDLHDGHLCVCHALASPRKNDI